MIYKFNRLIILFIQTVFAVLILASLIVPDGDDRNGNGNGNWNDERDEGQSVLQSIAGVWNSSIVEGGLQDINYTVIRLDGTASGYDYLGDSYDSAEDCYLKVDLRLSHEGGSRFTVTSPEVEGSNAFDTSVQSDILQQILLDNHETETYPPVQLTEAQFTPLCDSGFF